MSPEIIRFCELSPIMLNHYSAVVAWEQKITALLSRSTSQARDVFDLYLLLPTGLLSTPTLFKKEKQVLAKIRKNTLIVDFGQFKSQVISYLEPDLQPLYDSEETWDMRLVGVHARLLRMDRPVFQTSDAASYLGVGCGHASKPLAGLAASGHLIRVNRGLWGFKDRIDLLALPEYLTLPYPSYVSLQSALYYHGMISQIPCLIYAVSVARTKRYITPLSTVSVHHVDPSFFFGYQPVGKGPGKMQPQKKRWLIFSI